MTCFSPIELDQRVVAARRAPTFAVCGSSTRRAGAFDAAWPEQRVALALDGSVRLGRLELRGAGWIRDARQLNEAAIQGWGVLRLTPAQIEDGCVFELVSRALATPWRRA